METKEEYRPKLPYINSEGTIVSEDGVDGILSFLKLRDRSLRKVIYSRVTQWDKEEYIFQCLENDPTKIVNLRKKINAAGLNGKVSIDSYNGKTLPYADNLVNLVVSEDPNIKYKVIIVHIERNRFAVVLQ